MKDREEEFPGERLPAPSWVTPRALVESLAVLKTSLVVLTVYNDTNNNITQGYLQVCDTGPKKHTPHCGVFFIQDTHQH